MSDDRTDQPTFVIDLRRKEIAYVCNRISLE